MDATESIKLRGFEKLLYYWSLCGDVLVLATTIIDATDLAKLDENLFAQALDLFKRRHPFLSAQIVKNAKEVYLNVGNKVDGPKVESSFGKSFESKKKLIEELAVFNQKRFDYNDPTKCLWRVRLDTFVDEENDGNKRLALTLIIPLFITDGINIVVLLSELVNIINALLLGKDCEEMRVKHEIMDDFYDQCEKNGLLNEEKVEQVKLRIKQKSSLPNKFLIDPHLKTDAEARGLKMCFFTLDSATSQELIKTSKAHKVKLNGLLYAICLYALHDLYLENKLEFPKSLFFACPANLRVRAALSLSNMRHLINLLHFTLDSPSFGSFQDIWADSVEINKQVEAIVNIENGEFFTESHDFEAFDEIYSLAQNSSLTQEQITVKWSEMNSCDFMLSNTGTYAYEHVKNSSAIKEGPLIMKEVYFGDSLSSCPPLGPALLVHVSMWSDQLMFQVSANLSSIDAVHADRFVELFKTRACHCIKTL